MSAIGVVGNAELTGEGGHFVGLGPQFFGLLGVIGENIVTCNVSGVAFRDRSGEVFCGNASLVKDLLGHFLAVDSQ